MAKLSSINKNNRRIKLSDKFYKKRTKLKKIIMDKKISLEERFKAQQKLSKLPRNSAKNVHFGNFNWSAPMEYSSSYWSQRR